MPESRLPTTSLRVQGNPFLQLVRAPDVTADVQAQSAEVEPAQVRTHQIGSQVSIPRLLVVVHVAKLKQPAEGRPQVDHDGVADLVIDDGTQLFRCTGSLLPTGRHILTAAHCLTDGTGALTAVDATATFELTGGDVSDSSTNFHVHPLYDGDTGHGRRQRRRDV